MKVMICFEAIVKSGKSARGNFYTELKALTESELLQALHQIEEGVVEGLDEPIGQKAFIVSVTKLDG